MTINLTNTLITDSSSLGLSTISLYTLHLIKMRVSSSTQSEFTSELRVEEIVSGLVRNSTKNFKCLTCSKYFSSKHCLREHQFIHTGERPYNCQMCQKNFKHASQLSVHKKIHTVRYELRWPKLTDLLEKTTSPECEARVCVELVHLPLISGPQKFSLPKFE